MKVIYENRICQQWFVMALTGSHRRIMKSFSQGYQVTKHCRVFLGGSLSVNTRVTSSDCYSGVIEAPGFSIITDLLLDFVLHLPWRLMLWLKWNYSSDSALLFGLCLLLPSVTDLYNLNPSNSTSVTPNVSLCKDVTLNRRFFFFFLNDMSD